MNRKATLRTLLSAQPETETGEANPDLADSAEQQHTGSGAVKAMGDTLRKLTADAEIGRVLKDQLTEGARVLEIEPRLIERSFISDRLSDSDDPDFNALIESVRANGQLVPILVRPHPEKEGFFQVAYGHRRLHAAELLQIKVKAVVRYLSDIEMVVAQGKENSERRDLSFIERAVFAIHLEERGFERTVVMSALSIDKAETAKLLSVARAVPAEVILAIGPAPRIGRPRWVALARLIAQPGNEKKLAGILASDAFKSLSSDRRFEALFSSLSNPTKTVVSNEHWSNPAGRRVVTIQRRPTRTTFIFNESLEPAFGEYVVENLGSLYNQFKSRGGEGENGER
ncbi:MAG: plasmid partitioning protein RepB [Verrucomicrobia bacterium]|nr:plasmid partitioning protein RepB [Verrucomicrobiota bacterium]